MGGSGEGQHPLEVLYRIRDELQDAIAVQGQADLTKQDLPTYGWVLRSILDNLGELTATLATQVDDIDRDRIYRGALRNHPHEVIDHALEHLMHLRQSLNTAIQDAERYRSRAKDLHENVRDEQRRGSTE